MNCFKFRAPYETVIHEGYSEKLLKGLHNGFIFTPFGLDQDILCIPVNDITPRVSDHEFLDWIEQNDRIYSQNHPDSERTTDKDEHLQYIYNIQQKLQQYAEESEDADHTPGGGKIVAARIKVSPASLNPIEIFNKLLDRHHEAACFLFSTSEYGTWIGATPELLLHAWDTSLESLALAGSRPATSAPIDLKNFEKGFWPAVDPRYDTPWDEKNRKEQQMVTDFIEKILLEEGIKPMILPSRTRRAGKIEHIATEIIVNRFSKTAALARRLNPYMKADKKDRELFTRLLRRLSPTPALSGYPRDEAIDFIETHESGNRALYGGLIGIFYEKECSVQSFVNLRSGRFDSINKSISLYAGGGITPLSNPEEEWEETERKLTTMDEALK